MARTAVVILNYNGADYLRKFLPGVIQHTREARVIVADNASTDNSVKLLESNFQEVELIKLPENGGFSRGYNEALAQVTSDYYVLLNSDIEVTEGWLQPLITLMDSDQGIAACQPKILSYHDKESFEYAGAAGGYIDSLGYPFCKGRLFQTLEKDNGQFDSIYPVFWATGACLMIRSEIFHDLGGLDPDFFAHMEEIDLCWRIEAYGKKVMYNGNSRVYHVGGGTLHKSNPRKTYLNFRNGLTLLYKNYSGRELIYKFPLRLLLDIVAFIKFILFDSFPDGIAVFRAHMHFWSKFNRNYQKRRRTQKITKIRNHDTIFTGSIIWQYYILKRKRFSDLPFTTKITKN